MYSTKLRSAVLSVFGALLMLGTTFALQPEKDKESDDAAREQSRKNMQKIALAMHDYHDIVGTFPPAALVDKDNKQLLSWRVLLLPYLGEQDLFKQFDLYQPWRSPHNKKLLAKMPKVYAPVHAKTSDAHSTFYQVFTGNGAAFEGIRGLQLRDFTDGTSNTIMVIEAGEPVPWTRPADIHYDPKKPLPKLFGPFKDVIHMGVADGTVQLAKKGFNEKVFRLMITRNDGMPLGRLNPDE